MEDIGARFTKGYFSWFLLQKLGEYILNIPSIRQKFRRTQFQFWWMYHKNEFSQTCQAYHHYEILAVHLSFFFFCLPFYDLCFNPYPVATSQPLPNFLYGQFFPYLHILALKSLQIELIHLLIREIWKLSKWKPQMPSESLRCLPFVCLYDNCQACWTSSFRRSCFSLNMPVT